MKLKDIVINYRNENKLSQREFAAKCGLSNAAISIIEKDQVNPVTGKKTVTSIETCMKIARGMGITLEELFSQMDNVPLRIDQTENYYYKLNPMVAELIETHETPTMHEPINPLCSGLATKNDDRLMLSIFNSLNEEGKQYLLQQAKIAQQIYGGNKNAQT